MRADPDGPTYWLARESARSIVHDRAGFDRSHSFATEPTQPSEPDLERAAHRMLLAAAGHRQ